MKCWKCGSDNTDVSFCLYCGASLNRSVPVTNYGKALRKIFDDFGYEKVLKDPRCISSALNDLVPDSDDFIRSIEYVYQIGFGKLYESQIRKGGNPDENFYKSVKKKLMLGAGFSESKSEQLIRCFDEMIGWESLYGQSTSFDTEIKNTNINKNNEAITASDVKPNTSSSQTSAIPFPSFDQANPWVTSADNWTENEKTPSAKKKSNVASIIGLMIAGVALTAQIVFVVISISLGSTTATTTTSVEDSKLNTNVSTTTTTATTADKEGIYKRISKNEITFGRYEQDCDTTNGSDTIEWIVLEENDERIIVISKYILYKKEYDPVHSDVTWETSDLRKWLNNDFFNAAFNASEQEYIVHSNLNNPDNKQTKVSGGNDTTDCVYCLSLEELNKYQNSNSYFKERIATQATKFARGLGVEYDDWWLRTPGIRADTACSVSGNGSFAFNLCANVYNVQTGVRPVICIKK